MRAAALALLASGCGTWGVEVVEREVKASHPAGGIAAVTADLSVEGEVTASGGGSDAIGATADLVAWIEPGGSAALLDRVRIAMVPRGSTLAIEPDTKGAATEQIVLEDLDIVLPAAIDLDLAVSHGDVSVRNLDGHVSIAAPTSAVSLERTGTVDISAREVTAQLAGGGAIETTGGGAVTVTVLGDAFDQLLVTTETGPVTIHLPADRGWDIELATTGEATATVNLGGLSCGGAGAEPCDAVRFGDGGPLIRVESGGGAIAVDDVR